MREKMRRLPVAVPILFSCIAIISGSCDFRGNGEPVRDGSFLIANPDVWIPELPKKLKETSGLIAWDGLLWTINDSGGKNEIYGFDPNSGAIKREIRVVNASNHDWEALAADEDHIYIGDFGNNKGNRNDLKIYMVPKDSLNPGQTGVSAFTISFAYADQDHFAWLPRRHPFDCEAMISYHDSLYLFTKNWSSGMTKLYALPKQPGHYLIEPVDAFRARALVTDAAISPDENILVLTCYLQYNPSLWIFYDFQGRHFFSGKKVQVRYPEYYNAQTEGAGFWNADTLFVSAERSKRFSQAVYQFNIQQLLDSVIQGSR